MTLKDKNPHLLFVGLFCRCLFFFRQGLHRYIALARLEVKIQPRLALNVC